MKFRHFYICMGVVSQSYVSPDIERARRRGALGWWKGLFVSCLVCFAWPVVVPVYIRQRELGEI